jgi:hypothetical protein
MIDTDKYEETDHPELVEFEGETLGDTLTNLLTEVKRLRGLLDEIADFTLNEMESNKEHNHILMNNIMATALWRTNTWWEVIE